MSANDSPQSNPWTQLIRRAIEDPDFRESLVANPRTVIADATGASLPGDVEVVVVEDAPKRIHVVLPASDLDLDQIQASGGFGDYGPGAYEGACRGEY